MLHLHFLIIMLSTRPITDLPVYQGCASIEQRLYRWNGWNIVEAISGLTEMDAECSDFIWLRASG